MNIPRRLLIDRHVYHPTHGPQTWPWWKVWESSLVKASLAGNRNIYNWWIYTRWGAVCFEVTW